MSSKTRALPASVAGSSAGSAASLEALYARYGPYVAKMGLRLLGRPDEVDDLIQDVFVAAIERLANLRDPAAVKAWLASVTVRIALKRLRRRRLLRWLSVDDVAPSDELALVMPDASPESRVLLSQVFRALDRVSPADRLAWSLRVLEDQPLEAVAAMCRCSLATAKRRVAAAQAVLDRELGR